MSLIKWTYDSRMNFSNSVVKEITGVVDTLLEKYLKYPELFAVTMTMCGEEIKFVFNILKRPDDENLVSLVDTMTGYYATSAICRVVKNGITEIVQKPFSFHVVVNDSKLGTVINLKGLY